MTEYLTLTEFVPGTKAKAEDVNANFTVIKNAIGERALASGDNSVTFNVAEGTDANHAVNKKQLDSVLEKTVNSAKFCCNAGSTTNGVPSLFSLANNIITLTSSGALLTDNLGNNIVLANDLTLDVSGITGTVYIYYNSKDKVLFKTANKHVFAYSRPVTPVEDTIYVYINNNNWVAEIYKNSTWTTLEGAVYLGYYTMANNAGSVITNPYNQNEYEVNSLSNLISNSILTKAICNKIMPDFSSGSARTLSTVYHADCDGFLSFYISEPGTSGGHNANVSLSQNSDMSSPAFTYVGYCGIGQGQTVIYLIPKGFYYLLSISNICIDNIKFYPMKGAV